MAPDNDNNSWNDRFVDAIIPNRPSDRRAYENIKPPETHSDLRMKAWEKQKEMLHKRKWEKSLVEEMIDLEIRETNTKIEQTGLPYYLEVATRRTEYQLLLKCKSPAKTIAISRTFAFTGLTAERFEKEIDDFLSTIHLEDL